MWIGLVSALGCTGLGKAKSPTSLRPASDLQENCFGWPQREFTPTNRANRGEFITEGQAAVDFRLTDVNGAPVHLASLLKERPVLLVQGSYTCPVMQEKLPGLRATAQRYDSKIHTVLVYNIEAHPKGEANPYKGRRSEHEFSDRGQPRDYQGRVANAKDLKAGSDVTVAVDALGGKHNNPVWCTFGTCPSCAWLIRQDGIVQAMHDWYDPTSMDGSIEALLKQ